MISVNDWKLENIPPYLNGENISDIFDIGSGLLDDSFGPSIEDSYMQVVKNTPLNAFFDYVNTLLSLGFEIYYQRDENDTIYRGLFKEKLNIYLYYDISIKEARIIDCKSGLLLSEFVSDANPNYIRDNIEFMQFGLYYDKMISGITCDCGMNYVIRLKNNELIVIDGGEIEQSTKIAIEEFVLRVKQMTNYKSGKIIISTWFCTHSHDDHMDFFEKLIEQYSDLFEVKRVMFNFPSLSQCHGKSIPTIKEKLLKQYPEVKYLKLHTGLKFNIDGAEYDVLTSFEDLLGLEEDNTSAIKCNMSSTVLKITIDNKSFIFLGDVEFTNGCMLSRRFKKDGLKCDYIQAAHHCINEVENIYSFVKFKKMLMPQSRENINARFLYILDQIHKYIDDKDIIYAGDSTTVIEYDKSQEKYTNYDTVGCPYDGN